MKKYLFILLFLVLLAWLVPAGRDKKKTGFEFITDMVYPLPYETFASNPITPDHKTLQPLPQGSIPREFLPYHYGTTPEEAERAGRELTNPIPATAENLARGQMIFETFCLVCHGPEGEGEGPIIPKFPNPPSLMSETIRAYPEGRIFHIVTMGSVVMPSYATQIKEEDRWKLVRYVQTLQNPGGIKP